MTTGETISMVGAGCAVLGIIITYGKFQYNIGTLTQSVKSQQEEINEMKRDSTRTTERLFEKVDHLVEDMADVRANTDMMAQRVPEFVKRSECKECSS